MALFKVYRGVSTDLQSVEKVDGHAYFCTDDGSFWIDYEGTDKLLYRKQINEEELKEIKTLLDKHFGEQSPAALNGVSISGSNIYINDAAEGETDKVYSKFTRTGLTLASSDPSLPCKSLQLTSEGVTIKQAPGEQFGYTYLFPFDKYTSTQGTYRLATEDFVYNTTRLGPMSHWDPETDETKIIGVVLSTAGTTSISLSAESPIPLNDEGTDYIWNFKIGAAYGPQDKYGYLFDLMLDQDEYVATREWVNENIPLLNIENGMDLDGAELGSIQQKSVVHPYGDYVFEENFLGTQHGDSVPGAKANGYQSAAFGGLKYDYYTNEDSHANNLAIDPTIKKHFGRTRTSADGIQSFAAGGSVHAHGDWSVAFGKDTDAYQRGAVTFGGGNQAGLTEEEFNQKYTVDINGTRFPKYLSDHSNKPMLETNLGKNVVYVLDEADARASDEYGVLKYYNTDKSDVVSFNKQYASAIKVVEDRQGLPYELSWGFGFASGEVTKAIGRSSFAANYANKAEGMFSAAFNENNKATGINSFIVGKNGIVSGACAFKAGEGGIAAGDHSAVFGFDCQTTDLAKNSFVGGLESIVSGERSFAFGIKNNVSGIDSAAFGETNIISSNRAFAAGKNNIVTGNTAFAIGDGTQAKKYLSAAIGYNTVSDATGALAGGSTTQATGENSLAYGSGAKSSGANSVAFGSGTNANGNNSFAVGVGGSASGTSSVKFGEGCQASSYISIASGYNSKAQATGSFAGGMGSTAESTSQYAISYGESVITKNKIKAAFGTYNNPDVSNAIFTIGNGTAWNSRSNALVVFNDGRVAAGADAAADNELVRKGQLSNYLDKTTDYQTINCGLNIREGYLQVFAGEDTAPVILSREFIRYAPENNYLTFAGAGSGVIATQEYVAMKVSDDYDQEFFNSLY